jgi:hypothetical protein
MVCVAGAWQGAESRTERTLEVFSRFEVLPKIGKNGMT